MPGCQIKQTNYHRFSGCRSSVDGDFSRVCVCPRQLSSLTIQTHIGAHETAARSQLLASLFRVFCGNSIRRLINQIHALRNQFWQLLAIGNSHALAAGVCVSQRVARRAQNNCTFSAFSGLLCMHQGTHTLLFLFRSSILWLMKNVLAIECCLACSVPLWTEIRVACVWCAQSTRITTNHCRLSQFTDRKPYTHRLTNKIGNKTDVIHKYVTQTWWNNVPSNNHHHHTLENKKMRRM